MKIKIEKTEIQSLSPVDCPAELARPPARIGIARNIAHKDGVLSFDFGPSRVCIKSDKWPEWLVDGVLIEIDFVNTTITKR